MGNGAQLFLGGAFRKMYFRYAPVLNQLLMALNQFENLSFYANVVKIIRCES